ncbi:MAG: hypothetical protein ACXW3O_09880 [Brevundimonas sp.]
MRHLATIVLGAVIALASSGASVSQTTGHPGIDRCNAGLQRSIGACNNMHDAGSTGWDKCIAYSVSMHRICVLEAVEHMDTIEG